MDCSANLPGTQPCNLRRGIRNCTRTRLCCCTRPALRTACPRHQGTYIRTPFPCIEDRTGRWQTTSRPRGSSGPLAYTCHACCTGRRCSLDTQSSSHHRAIRRDTYTSRLPHRCRVLSMAWQLRQRTRPCSFPRGSRESIHILHRSDRPARRYPCLHTQIHMSWDTLLCS